MSLFNLVESSNLSSPNIRNTSENQGDNEIVSYGASTPRAGHHNCPFTPFDVSSVESDGSPRKRVRTSHPPLEKLQEVPEGKSSARSKKKRSNIDKLKDIISETLASSSRRSFLKNSCITEIDDSTDNSSSSDLHLKKKPKYVHKGQDWKQFKPKTDARMYSDVLTKPYDTSITAEIWIQEYRNDTPQAVVSLLQFIADVCGYQEFDAATVFDYERENYSEVVDFMQRNPPQDLKETGKYLMKTTSDWGIQSQEAVYKFFEHLLQFANNYKMLCDSNMLKAIISFIFGLTWSCIKPLKHTGVVIAAKMITSFLNIEENANNKLNTSVDYDIMSNQEITELTDYIEMLKQTLEQFIRIIEDNCCLSDPTLDKLKITCIEEMINWFNIKPSLLNSTRLFRRLMILVKDWSKAVRLSALGACCKLVETRRHVENMKQQIKYFVEVVGSRMYDADYTVASTAVKVYSRMIKTYPDDIPQRSHEAIMIFLYGKNLELAKAAGEFLMELFQKLIDDEEGNTYDPIKQLIKVAQITDDDHHNVLLVEALIHCCPFLKDWNKLIGLLLSNELTDKDEVALIDIMCHAAYITLTGKAKVGRTMYSNKSPKAKDARAAIEAFLASAHLLLKKFSNEPRCLEKLSDVLVVMDLTDASLFLYKTEIIHTLQTLRGIFVKNKHLELLENVSKIFSQLLEEECPFKGIALPIISTLKEAVVEAFFSVLEMANNSSKEIAVKVQECLLKLSVLFAHNDMTNLIDHKFLFNELLKAEDHVSLKYYISCCYHYLVWSLKEIIKDNSKPDLKNNITLLNSLREDFQKTCFLYMNSSEDYEICKESFERICSVHITFRMTLQGLIKFRATLKQLIPPALEADYSVQLIDFAEKFIFKNIDETSQKIRRLSLGNMLNLAFYCVVDYKLYCQIFQYYHSFNKPYGDIFKSAFNTMRAEAHLLLVIVMLQTMIHCYNTVKEDEVTTEKLEAATDFRKLVKEFQLYISRSSEEIQLMLHLGTNWAISSETRYGFLYFLRSFSTSLPEKEKQTILESFNAKVPSQDKENEFILGFIMYLKHKAKKDTGKKKLSDNESTTDSNENSIYVDDTEIIDEYNAEDSLSEIS